MQVKEDTEERLELTESYPDNKQSRQHDDQQMLMRCLRELKRGQQAVINILEFLLKKDGLLIDDWTSTNWGSRSAETARVSVHLDHIDDRVPDDQLQSEQPLLMNSPTLDPVALDKSTSSRTRKPLGTGRPKIKSRQSLLKKPTMNLRGEDAKQGELTYGTLPSSGNTWGNSKSSTSDSGPRMGWLSESSRESTQPGRVYRSLRGSRYVE